MTRGGGWSACSLKAGHRMNRTRAALLSARAASPPPPPPPPPPVPSPRAITTGTGAAGTNSFTLPARVSGDTLVAVVETDNSATGNAANTGWTRRLLDDDGVAVGLKIFTRTSNGTDNSPVSGNPNSPYSWTIFSVQDAASGFDVVSTPNGGSGGLPETAIVAGSVTPTGTALLISAYVRSFGTGSVTPPGGQTATPQVQTAGATLRCGYETVAAGATGTRTATNSDAQPWAAGNIVVK